MLDSIFESLKYVLPAIIVGIVAYFMFKELLFRQNEQQKFQALQSKKRNLFQSSYKPMSVSYFLLNEWIPII